MAAPDMPDLLHNEVQDKDQDRIYADVAGMLTHENNPEIFGPDLLPGETIVREFRAFHIDQSRHSNRIKLYYILTLGLYWCWIKCCSCLRAFGIGNKRTRACVTDFGRMMLWDSDCDGKKKGFHQGFHATTNMEWFHLDDINSFQMLVRRENRCGPCKICRICGVFGTVSMRLFFGNTYPSTKVLNEKGVNDIGAIQGLWKPEWSRSDFLVGHLGGTDSSWTRILDKLSETVKNAICYLGPSFFHLLTCGLLYHEGLLVPSAEYDGKGEFALDIGSLNDEDWKDGYHYERSDAWSELISFANLILNAKETEAPLAGLEPNRESFVQQSSDNMNSAADSKLILDKKVAIDDAKFPFADDEHVVDAIEIQPRMSWFEFFFIPTITCKRKYKSNNAAILSTTRATSVSECRSVFGGDYDFSMTSYFIGKIKGGMMITDPRGSLGYATDIQTTYGGLRIQPVMSNKWPWSRLVPDSKKEQMYAFIRNLERASNIEKHIQAPVEGTLPNQEEVDAIKQRLDLWDGEEISSVLRSENNHNVSPFLEYPCISGPSCNDLPTATKLVQCCSCGARPWHLDQHLVLTTHRMISVQDIDNSCMIGFCQGKAKLLLWVSLAEVEAMRMTADFKTPLEHPVQRFCKNICECLCNRDAAYLDVYLGRKGRYGPAQFRVGRVADRPKQGLIEGRADLKHFRAAVGHFQSQKKAKRSNLVVKKSNEKYGEPPFPKTLLEHQNVTNPQIGRGGVESGLVAEGSKGGDPSGGSSEEQKA